MNVEFVRDCIMRAFLLQGSPSTSKVDNVKETRECASRFLQKPFRIEQFDDRKIHVPVEPVKASETRSYKGAKLPLLPTAFEDTSWRRAVRESDPVYRIWLRYCYSDDLDWDGQIAICHYVWSVFWTESVQNGVMVKPETEARLRTLVWLSVQSAKQLMNSGTKMFTDAELAEILHIHKSVFSRWIKEHWHRMVGHCLMLDDEALTDAERCHRSREQH